MITVKDIAWAAGFLEGEGSFTRRARGCLEMTCAQVQREPLERLQKIFGGDIYFIKRNPAKNNGGKQKDYYRWRRCGTRAAEICMTIFGLMSPRRKDQIEPCLRAWRASGGKGSFGRSMTHCSRGHEYTPENTARQSNGTRKCRACAKEYNRNYARKLRPLVLEA